MRLSMWMLTDWLVDYHPVVTIERGARTLRNVRLLPSAADLSRSTVYLDSDESDNVLCIHDRDMLVLSTSDIDQVLNDILDAFDFYNEWASDLHDAAQGGCSVRELMEMAEPVMGRFMVLADATYYVREFVGDRSILEHSEASKKTLVTRSMPLDVIMRINAMEGVRSRSRATYLIDLPEMDTLVAVSNLFVGARHEGWLVGFTEGNTFTQGQLDLQDAFAGILAKCIEVQAQGAEHTDRAAVFAEVLSGAGEEDEQTIYRRLATLGWARDDEKLVYLIRQVEQQKNPQHVIERFLEHIDLSSIAVSFQGDLLYFVDASLTVIERLEAEIRKTLTMCGCAAGRSPRFTDIFAARSHYLAAKVAADAAQSAGAIIGYQDVKLPYALSLIREGAVADVSHDALGLLAAYDAAHATDLLETLRVYLRCGCGATEAARSLFVHRSTLLYRIERIQEIAAIDLSDPDERFLLELSLRL